MPHSSVKESERGIPYFVAKRASFYASYNTFNICGVFGDMCTDIKSDMVLSYIYNSFNNKANKLLDLNSQITMNKR